MAKFLSINTSQCFAFESLQENIAGEEISLITQPGDRLGLPEMVRVVPGRLEAPGKTLAQGKEMESSLDLLLLLLWERTQLHRRQEKRS